MLVDEQMVPENSVQQIELLTTIDDDYGGVHVEIKNPMDSNVFGNFLRASILQWRQKGTKGVWIKLPIEHANLIEAAVKEGFWYHHAQPDYLMLVHWIPKTAHTLPANASHRVGIGAFVVNSKREVLVVQENSGIFKGTGVWKLPTGVVNEGEDICTAAIREVEEETGIKTEFVEVLSFMQNHKAFFTKSDLFFVCMLQPLSSEIQKQDEEIEAAQVVRSKMSSAKLMFLLVLWLLVSRTFCARKDGVYGDGVSTPSDCQNCSICPYPCHPQSPPPPPGYPSSGAPSPPAATGNCPPTSAGCCQYPQPSPPSPYTYVPYNNYSASPPMPLSSKSPVSILFTIVILFGFVSLHLV